MPNMLDNPAAMTPPQRRRETVAILARRSPSAHQQAILIGKRTGAPMENLRGWGYALRGQCLRESVSTREGATTVPRPTKHCVTVNGYTYRWDSDDEDEDDAIFEAWGHPDRASAMARERAIKAMKSARWIREKLLCR